MLQKLPFCSKNAETISLFPAILVGKLEKTDEDLWAKYPDILQIKDIQVLLVVQTTDFERLAGR